MARWRQPASRLIASFLLLLLTCGANSPPVNDGSKYVVVVDLGSSGSRAFVYRFHPGPDGAVTGSKGLKVRPGISELATAREFGRAAAYLGPLFNHTKHVVPEELHASTPIFLRATAGMRLLPAELQQELFDTLYKDLAAGQARLKAAAAQGTAPLDGGDEDGGGVKGSFLCPFLLRRSHISTIDGAEEGYFAALSVNYLSGTVDAKLRMQHPAAVAASTSASAATTSPAPAADGELSGRTSPPSPLPQLSMPNPLGALDLGGASTQVVFSPMLDSAALRRRQSSEARRSSGSSAGRNEPLGELEFAERPPAEPMQCGNSGVASGGLAGGSNCSAPVASLSLPERGGAGDEVEVDQHGAPPSSASSLVVDVGGDGVLDRSDFLARSYLGFGADQIRLRLWSRLLRQEEQIGGNDASSDNDIDDEDIDDESAVTFAGLEVANPCSFVGQVNVWRGGRLVGTGASEACAVLVQDLLFADCGQRFDLRRRAYGITADAADAATTALSTANDTTSASPASASAPPTSAVTAAPLGRRGCPMGGYPGLPSVRGVQFVAMSVYFFALDCLRELGPAAVRHALTQEAEQEGQEEKEGGAEQAAEWSAGAASPPAPSSSLSAPPIDAAAAQAAESALTARWPAPSLEQVRDASAAFCGMGWDFVDGELQGLHEWTWDHQMPHRCFEVVLITTLLRDGFGFDAFGRGGPGDGGSSSSDGGAAPVSFAVEVGGMELEWTLGYALASVADK